MSSRLALLALLVIVAGAACGDNAAPSTTAFSGLTGCEAGAGSAITFLQRTLDDLDDAEPEDVAALAPDFDKGVNALLLRAQEVHCTEDGFNRAIIVRVDELDGGGPRGELLILEVRERGLGSLDADNGGPLRLPGE
jgi:hypothetical protein